MMIQKSYLFVLICLCLSTISVAQEKPFHELYDWEENPIESINIEDFIAQDVVVFKDKKVNEFVFVKENALVEYVLTHKLYWLNSNDKIEEYNKVYLPESAGSELVKSKARVISKNGKIKELDDSKILSSTDQETKRSYKYFALEGIEKGSFIEYYHVIVKRPAYSGKSLHLQTEVTKKNVSFDLLAPTNLVFDIKSYNGLPNMVKDTINKDKNHWKLHLESMDALEEETQAPYSALSQYLVYKLKANTMRPSTDIVSYSIGSKNIYNSIYQDIDKKTQSKIGKFVKGIPNADGNEVVKKIRAIEHYIKTNIFLTKVQKEGLSDLSTILDKKVANDQGLMILYAAVLKNLGVKHEIVLTTDRRDLKFDMDFEAYNFLQEYLIYFPKEKLYMSPSRLDSRLGFPPGYLTDNHGLFIKEVTLGDYSSGVGKVKYIDPINFDKTNYDLVMDVQFDPEDITTTNLKMDRRMSGYYASMIQPFMYLAKEDDRDKMIDGIIKSINENVDIIDKKVNNDTPEDFGSKPLQIIATLKATDFVEKAGNKYLFKVGMLLGQQQEMYQEKKRKLSLENEYERSYNRKIIVDIPEGYQFRKLEDLIIDESYEEGDETFFMFKSGYEIKNRQLHISIKEYYNKNIIELPLYESYRKVINSAANFNKVTLVLEKI